MNVAPVQTIILGLQMFVGQRGPPVLPSVGSVRSVPSVLKIWITYIKAYALGIKKRLIKPILWPHVIP